MSGLKVRSYLFHSTCFVIPGGCILFLHNFVLMFLYLCICFASLVNHKVKKLRMQPSVTECSQPLQNAAIRYRMQPSVTECSHPLENAAINQELTKQSTTYTNTTRWCISTIDLLMMNTVLFETCREVKYTNTLKKCVKLVIGKNRTNMHGQQNITNVLRRSTSPRCVDKFQSF